MDYVSFKLNDNGNKPYYFKGIIENITDKEVTFYGYLLWISQKNGYIPVSGSKVRFSYEMINPFDKE